MKDVLRELYEDEPVLFFLIVFIVSSALTAVVCASIAKPLFGLFVIGFLTVVWIVGTLIKKWIGVK
ncbi:hypothetical protein [Weissella tructae]